MKGKMPTGPIRDYIRRIAEPYSLDRRDGADGSTYGGGVDYTQDAAEANLYLYNPSTSHEIANVGEQTQGILSGLCLPSEDVQTGDRLSYVDGRYEIIEPIQPQPSEQHAEFLVLSLDKVPQPHDST